MYLKFKTNDKSLFSKYDFERNLSNNFNIIYLSFQKHNKYLIKVSNKIFGKITRINCRFDNIHKNTLFYH